MAAEQSNSAIEFSLATILNVLWRRKIIVLGLPILGLIVGLLYGNFGTKRWAATANVRPGITAFSPEGGPYRQWQLKDITTWYNKLLYRQELNKRLGLPKDARPVIRSEFIATGLTNLAGGEVVTLWTTATSPELAATIIDTSIALFKEYAEADTLSSQIKLTRDGLKLQIKVQETRLMSVDKLEASLNLQLQAARADSLVVAVLDRELGIELDKIERKQTYFSKRIDSLKKARPAIEKDMSQIDGVLASVADGQNRNIDPATVPAWARRDAVLDGGDVMDGLANVRIRLQQQLAHNLAQQDSFGFELDIASLDYVKREVSRASTVESKLRDIEKRIGDLELQKDYELPVKRQEIRNDINSRLVQMGTLTTLQRVGTTQVSDKPVRPRGMRATMILVFLGVIGGLVLGFVTDYLLANRQQIFRS